MRHELASFLSLGLLTGTAVAGTSVTVTPMGGSIVAPHDFGAIDGFRYSFPIEHPGTGPPFALYDNVPTFLGGTSDPRFGGPFGSIGTYFFLDWEDPSVQWGDDLHQISTAGPGPAVVTSLWYAYLNTAATSTHTIRIYDMVPPSVVPTVTSTIVKGSLLTSIVLPGQPFSPSGAFVVTVTGLSIGLPNSAVWIKLHDAGPGFGDTFWLTGGNPGIGYTHPGFLGDSPYNGPSNDWIDFYYVSVNGLYYATTNVAVGLGGYHIPAPATMAVLALGGLLALRRRRG